MYDKKWVGSVQLCNVNQWTIQPNSRMSTEWPGATGAAHQLRPPPSQLWRRDGSTQHFYISLKQADLREGLKKVEIYCQAANQPSTILS